MILPYKCCGCFNLTTGGILVGVMGILGSIAWFVFNVVDSLNFTTRDEVEHYFSMGKVLFTAMTFLELITSAMLIVGTAEWNPNYLLPWLIYNSTTTVISAYISIIQYVGDKHRTSWQCELLLLINICLIGLEIYIFICVYSLYEIVRIIKIKNNAKDSKKLNDV